MQDTPTADRWTKRSFLGIPFIGWALLAMAGTALAAGVYYLTLSTTGTISTADGIEGISFVWGGNNSVSSNVAPPAECSSAILDQNDPTSLRITATNLLPGDYCQVEVEIANSGTTDAAFAGLQASYPEDGSVPGFGDRWNCDQNGENCAVNYCGTVIPAGGSAVVGVRLDVGGDQLVPGASYDFGGDDGFMFVPAGSEECG